MRMNRILGAVALGITALGIAGCDQTDYRGHNYSSKIKTESETDSVSFVATDVTPSPYEYPSQKKIDKKFSNAMYIYKQSGNIITYLDDRESDLSIDSIIVKVPIPVPVPAIKTSGTLADELGGKRNEEPQEPQPVQYDEKHYSKMNTSEADIILEGQRNFDAKYKKLEEIKIKEGKKLVK